MNGVEYRVVSCATKLEKYCSVRLTFLVEMSGSIRSWTDSNLEEMVRKTTSFVQGRGFASEGSRTKVFVDSNQKRGLAVDIDISGIGLRHSEIIEFQKDVCRFVDSATKNAIALSEE